MAKITNYPTSAVDSVSAEENTELLTNLLDLSNFGHVRGSSGDDELFRTRTKEYFDFCATHGLRVGVEGLANCLGCTRQTLFNWKRGVGCSRQRQEDVESAYQTISAYLEQLGLSGKLNPASYIWLCKNWLNYRDSITLETDNVTERIVESTPEQIAERYRDATKPQIPVELLNPDYENET